jgi:hypothetical protein
MDSSRVSTRPPNFPLQSEIYEEGKELKASIIEKLTAGSMTNVIVNFG